MGKFSEDIIKLFEIFKEEVGDYQDLDLENVEFEEKKLIDFGDGEGICKQRMGFTPKTSSNGDIYFFKVRDLTNAEGLEIEEPQTEEMTKREYIDKVLGKKSKKRKPIQKDEILVSFKLTVGVAKIYNSDKPAYCNEAIDILTLKKGYHNKYLALIIGKKYKELANSETVKGKSLNEDLKKEIYVPIPKPTGNYSSYDIQKAIAEFIEFISSKSDDIVNLMEEITQKTEKGKENLICKIFDKLPNGEITDDVINLFNEFKEEEKYRDLDLEDIGFEDKKLIDFGEGVGICYQRMGFTPKTDPDGDIYFFKVGDLSKVEGLEITEPQTEEMTKREYIDKVLGKKSKKRKPIQKDEILVSFKLTVGVAKIYNSDKPAYCNEAIDILTLKKGYHNKYLALIIGKKYKELANSETVKGKSLNEDLKKEIYVPIPKPTGNYSSYDIQKAIAEFIEFVRDKFDNIKEDAYERITKANKLKNLILKKFFL